MRRVVEAQVKHLPALGINLVDSPAKADLIASHIMLPHTGRGDAWQRSDVPLVVHSHGLYWAEYEWEAWAHKANVGCVEAFRQADAITAPTEWVAQSIRRNTLRDVDVIGHGVDLDQWSVQPHKGYALWNKTRTDAVCDPEALNELVKMADHVQFISTYGEAGPDNLTLIGRVPYEESKRLVSEAGVYLCTARETFGIGTIEAMAAGVPVLGWRWGGQADIVEHEQDGYLVTPGDFNDLLYGLNYCLEHRARLSAHARAKVEEQFQWEQVIPRYADLYRRVVAERRAYATRVSIVVPAYNLAQYLPRALDSVIAQDVADWECIVVDDASPDDTGRIADEYAARDARVRVIHNETNQYLAGALNTGIAAAKGRYVMPLDADNTLSVSAVGLLADALDADRSISIAYGNVEFIEPDGRQWHSGWPMNFRGSWQTSADGRNMIPSTAMMRKTVHTLTGGYRKRWRTAEDADFWTRATSYGFRAKMITQADVLHYFNRDDSMSRVEEKRDWTVWYPWRDARIPPPAAIVREDSPTAVLSYDPPIIAVVIPVGPGHEELYIDAIDSVDAQTFRFFECIVVNDTGAPLRYVPTWAKLINTKGREGVAAARNAGVRASHAPLFVPLDADDMLEPSALENMYRVYRTHKGYVYPDWYEVWESQKLTKTWTCREYNADDLLRVGAIHAVTALYPTKVWAEVGGFDESLPAWEDWDFMLKLANVGVCGTRLPVPGFVYRKESGQRREDNYANFEESKAAIFNKWKPYFQKEAILMGCNSCGGGGGGQVNPADFQSQASAAMRGAPAPPDGAEEYSVVEYVGDKVGVMAFTGPSGQRYQFSSLTTEKVKFVRKEDADWFAQKSAFRVRQPERV